MFLNFEFFSFLISYRGLSRSKSQNFNLKSVTFFSFHIPQNKPSLAISIRKNSYRDVIETVALVEADWTQQLGRTDTWMYGFLIFTILFTANYLELTHPVRKNTHLVNTQAFVVFWLKHTKNQTKCVFYTQFTVASRFIGFRELCTNTYSSQTRYDIRRLN